MRTDVLQIAQLKQEQPGMFKLNSFVYGLPTFRVRSEATSKCYLQHIQIVHTSRHGFAEDDRWHLRRDGTRFWGSGVLTAHRDNPGTLQGFSKVMRDLTSRKVMEEKLRESEERFRLFSQKVRDYSLLQVDTAGAVSGWNPGAERTFGYTELEILGRPVNLFFLPEADKEASRKKISAVPWRKAGLRIVAG